jgi:hypothetical protein
VAVIFPRWTNYLPLAVGVGVPVLLVAVTFGVWYWFSPEFTDVGYAPTQPVPFSHRTHAGDLGMDCRYCHNTVEEAAYAAIPPTATCMNCHTQVLPESNRLARVRNSAQTGEPIRWVRVHMLPDYAYFDHSSHLAAGVGCVECHGRIDQMPVVTQREPLSMAWCLDCHRDPGPSIRPAGVAVTQMDWEAPPGHDLTMGQAGREVNPPLHCSGCHR